METKRTRRSFSPDFKKQAAQRVLLLNEELSNVAHELEIKPEMLTRWIKEYQAMVASDPSHAAPSATENRPVIKITKRKPKEQETPELIETNDGSASVQETKLEQIHTKTEEPQAPSPKLETPREPEVEPRTVPQAEIKEEPVEEKTVSQEPEVKTEQSDPYGKSPSGERNQENSFNHRRQGRPQRNNQNGQRNHRNDRAPNTEKIFSAKPAGEAVSTIEEPVIEGFEEDVTPVEPPKPKRPVPKASEGRKWRVSGVLDQRPNYREENEHYGYVDEFDIPAEDLDQVWQILDVMQEKADSRAFGEMVHERGLNVPDEIMFNPRLATVQGPNIPNKPWLRKPRLHPVAEEFFQTTPDYTKAVYETYEGLDIRLGKNSDGTPILGISRDANGKRNITVDFSKFDRFVDDFYGDFVHDCKKVMMALNPKEYPGLNAFIRIPDEPLWNPKLWAGVRTFEWNEGESLSNAWIRYANSLRRNTRNRRN